MFNQNYLKLNKASLIKTFGLSLQLAKAEFKLKNEGSYLGILWYLLNPLLTFSLLFFIFSDRLGGDIENYPAYLLLGVIMFNFFQQTTRESTRSILNYSIIIKSINFTREALVGSIVLKNLFAHLFEIVIMIIILIILDISLQGIIFYPLILILLVLFTYGVSLFLAALTVYFVDLHNIWPFVSSLLWLATPIFYDIAGQTRLFIANIFNPLYYFITIARDIIIYNRMPELWLISGALVYPLVFLVLGSFVFKKLKNKFAEIL